MFRLDCDWIDASDPDRSGFDLGHLTFTSDEGTCTSKGRTPDQAMMVILSLVGLLDGLRTLLTGNAAEHVFVGVDASFAVRFRKAKKGRVALQCGTVSLGEVEARELCQGILSGVESFVARPESTLPQGDAGQGDLTMALAEFRQAFPYPASPTA